MKPPRILERLLELVLPPGLSGEGTLGDLAEEYARRAGRAPVGARLWYAGQVLSLVGYRLTTGGGSTVAGRSDLVTDLRWSFRALLRHPAFSLGVTGVLALGLGASTAVFSVVDGTLRNAGAWSAPERTVAIWPDSRFSYGQLQLYRDEQSVYRTVGGYLELAYSVRTSDGDTRSVNGVAITPELFGELAVQPGHGRALTPDDAFVGAERVVVIGEELWTGIFGGRADIIGSRIEVAGSPATVVGIQGPGADAPGGRAELWFPHFMDPRDDDFWRAQNLSLVGVLADGASLDDAYQSLMAYTDRLSALYPMFFPPDFADGLASVSFADATQRREVSVPLLLLLGGTALLMVATALNVGSLLLARSIRRRRELGVRSALGATPGRIVRQLLVEGGLLTGLALMLGLTLAGRAGDWIARLFAGDPVVERSPVLSPAVLLFALGSAALAWVVLNGVPIGHFLRSHGQAMRGSVASSSTTQRALVTVQAALATLLLVSAALLVGTVDNLRRIPLGFEPSGLVAVELSPPEDRVESVAAARALYDRLLAAAASLPGVDAAGLTGWLPLRAEAPPAPINLESAPVDPARAVKAPMHRVDAGFFEALGVEASDGRLFGSEERADEPSGVLVNRSLADLLWPGGSPVGQRIAIDPHAWDRFVPVLGVVPDIRSGAITEPAGPALYVALAESPARDVTLVLRSSEDPARLIPSVRRTVSDVDPLVPVRSATSMGQVVRTAYATSWVMMGLLVVLACLATGLGALGVYAVLAHYVTSNRKAIGVRMALGAHPGAIVGGVVRSGLELAGIGVLVGCVAAALSTRLLRSVLFEIDALAPLAYVAPALALGLATVLAAWIPAQRAARLPPADVLRAES